MLSLIARLYRFYRPYFGFKNTKKWRLLVGATILGNSFVAAYCMKLVTNTINSIMDVLSSPVITHAAFVGSLGNFLAAMVLYSCIMMANIRLGSWLAESLSYAMNKKFIKKWLKSNAYFGIKFLHNKHSALDKAQIMTNDNPSLNSEVLSLILSILMVAGNFVVGATGLYAMSVPLTFTLAGASITIPAYLLISTVIYGIVFNSITTAVGKSLKVHLDRAAVAQSEFHHKIHHVDTRAEAIAFKKGAAYEIKSLLETCKNNRYFEQAIANTRSAITFLRVFSSNFTTFVSLLLATPSVVAGALNLTRLFELSRNFSFVVELFTWKSDNFDNITCCEVNLTKMEALDAELKEWEAIQKAHKKEGLSVDQEGDFIMLDNLTIKMSDATTILADFNAKLPKGKITLLEGKSGSGKTSVLRVFTGLNPFYKGKIEGKPPKTESIPSEPYFPYNKTLLQAIMYPREEPATPEEEAKVCQLMLEMGFDQSKVQELHQVKDWYGPVLSDGERKRIMIIAALMKEPDLLTMDEATRGIDIPTKEKVERILRERLANATILYTDHNPSETTFYDQRIKLGA